MGVATLGFIVGTDSEVGFAEGHTDGLLALGTLVGGEVEA
jgi:hypothetical protein